MITRIMIFLVMIFMDGFVSGMLVGLHINGNKGKHVKRWNK